MQTTTTDVVIIGAGAAGLMCAATAGYRGRKVLVLDHAKKAGRKILISGGGRCNFTNVTVEPRHYLCANPHFVKSALARYPSSDFIELVERHGVDYEERDFGQLFCLDSAKEIVDVLMTECEWAGVTIQLRTEILSIEALPASDADSPKFRLTTNGKTIDCQSLVIATGGLSMPKLGATAFGYKVAEQFNIPVKPTTAALVPFTWKEQDKTRYEPLSGISFPVTINADTGPGFTCDMLFTHRGLSGPAVLQISNYWQMGETVTINLLPHLSISDWLAQQREVSPKQQLKTALSTQLPKRFIETHSPLADVLETPLNQLTKAQLQQIEQALHHWVFSPNGTEGYRTAEVTKGGVDCDYVSSKTMEAQPVPGLYFIGEVLDVTGWLGGYNFQWAWASGVAAGGAV